MSKVLALDSSSDACSVALLCDGQITSLFELAAKSHTQRLLPMVDEILQQVGCDRRELDAIAFGRGPGSFTGLRICLGIVQGLAYGLKIPVIPVSTLSAIASGFYARAMPENSSTITLVALDARMDEVYWGLFQQEQDSPIPRALTDEFVMAPAQVGHHDVIKQFIQSQSANSIIAVGPGWRYPELQHLPHDQLHLEAYPHAQDIVRIAQLMMTNGETFSAFDVQPVYLRDEVSWQKRQRIRS